MSSKDPDLTLPAEGQAAIFAALGDQTRLSLVIRLTAGQPHSITQLTHGSSVTRQAITKHLRVLENAGIVRSTHTGRESLFELNPKTLEEIRHYLDQVSRQWDEALTRLKSFAESKP